MRQRKVKNIEEKLGAVSQLRVVEPESYRGRWDSIFCNGRDILLELGCGRGQFLCSHATANPAMNFIGIEGQDSVVLRALERAQALELTNIRFVGCFVKDITQIFACEELAGVYLNFSDPWPKERHAKRRLTYHAYLEQYKKIIRPGGFLEFKTDNDVFFEFTIEEVEKCGFSVSEISRDLHKTTLDAAKITTEYEDKFKMAKKNINYLKIQL